MPWKALGSPWESHEKPWAPHRSRALGSGEPTPGPDSDEALGVPAQGRLGRPKAALGSPRPENDSGELKKVRFCEKNQTGSGGGPKMAPVSYK